MKKLFLLALLVAPVALFAAVTETVIFENNFDSYTPGNFYGQDADFQIMYSDVNCTNEAPRDGEVTIVYDEERPPTFSMLKEPKLLKIHTAKTAASGSRSIGRVSITMAAKTLTF